jgi:hypothetical protein
MTRKTTLRVAVALAVVPLASGAAARMIKRTIRKVAVASAVPPHALAARKTTRKMIRRVAVASAVPPHALAARKTTRKMTLAVGPRVSEAGKTTGRTMSPRVPEVDWVRQWVAWPDALVGAARKTRTEAPVVVRALEDDLAA